MLNLMSVIIEIPKSWESIAGPLHVEENLIEAMKLDWKVVLAMTLVVITAGAASSLMQLLKPDQSKILVATCGAISAAVTAFVGMVYPLSAKEMRERILRAEAEIRRAGTYMAVNDLPASEGRSDHLGKVLKHLENSELIIVGGGRPAGGSLAKALSFVSVAYAAETAFKDFPKNDTYLYFVGTSVGESLDGARADSIRLAQQEVQRAVLDQLPPSADSSSIAELLGNTGSVADTTFDCSDDDGHKRCQYSVLYAIKRQTADFYLSSSGVDRTQALEAIQKQASYYEQRWQAYAGALDFAREKLSAQQYRTLLAGRVAKRGRDYSECVRILAPAVKKGKPGWYLGWLNLGLAYWSLGKNFEAQAAFAEATALEPSLPVRDASIYNTYGQFLVERKNYAEARTMLTKALAINPDITGARYAMKLAEKQPAADPSKELAAETVQ